MISTDSSTHARAHTHTHTQMLTTTVLPGEVFTYKEKSDRLELAVSAKHFSSSWFLVLYIFITFHDCLDYQKKNNKSKQNKKLIFARSSGYDTHTHTHLSAVEAAEFSSAGLRLTVSVQKHTTRISEAKTLFSQSCKVSSWQ